MQRLTISAHFRGQATQPSGDPPEVEVTSRSVSVSVHAADGSDAGVDSLAYTTHATFTGEAAFTESGTMTVDDGDAGLDFATVREGILGPSTDPELHHGSVIWRIDGGHGGFERATGLITSDFLLRPATGEVDERQVAVVFLS
jgi:hypothetical protein